MNDHYSNLKMNLKSYVDNIMTYLEYYDGKHNSNIKENKKNKIDYNKVNNVSILEKPNLFDDNWFLFPFSFINSIKFIFENVYFFFRTKFCSRKKKIKNVKNKITKM